MRIFYYFGILCFSLFINKDKVEKFDHCFQYYDCSRINGMDAMEYKRVSKNNKSLGLKPSNTELRVISPDGADSFRIAYTTTVTNWRLIPYAPFDTSVKKIRVTGYKISNGGKTYYFAKQFYECP